MTTPVVELVGVSALEEWKEGLMSNEEKGIRFDAGK